MSDDPAPAPSRPFSDHYVTLQLSPAASAAEIHAAYRLRKREAQGDERGRVEKAYEVLSNPTKRGRYDRIRGERLAAGSGDAAARPEVRAEPVQRRVLRRPSPPPARAPGGSTRALPGAPRSGKRGSGSSRASAPAVPSPPKPPWRVRIHDQFTGPVGACHGALAGLVVVFVGLQTLTWATVATQRGTTATYSTLGGPHPGVFLGLAALVVCSVEIALFDHRRWWIARAGSLLFVLIASSTASSVAAGVGGSASFLGIPIERETVQISGIPALTVVVCLAYALGLAARTLVAWRVRRRVG